MAFWISKKTDNELVAKARIHLQMECLFIIPLFKNCTWYMNLWSFFDISALLGVTYTKISRLIQLFCLSEWSFLCFPMLVMTMRKYCWMNSMLSLRPTGIWQDPRIRWQPGLWSPWLVEQESQELCSNQVPDVVLHPAMGHDGDPGPPIQWAPVLD
jgi:hypothetical protein